ncbi:tRNA (N(6)-L-threonylcarbamoyladenosine(37)-C(2))-methylthiotransferase MtaB [bacterium]|nr:MAG: tRNA (N(6)-L-threonylcarbamoyladenosine(37)-C(2))-methylthiotransferase MtaB [bacterium]
MRVCFTNLGCKLNQAEIERLARDLTAAGHLVVESLEEADLHVINSCTVTHTAARSSRKAAGRARRAGLPVRTVLTGCHVSEDPEAAARLAGVDLVVPNHEKDRLVERVHAAFPDAAPEIPVPYVPLPFGPTRALVKVEDGCNMRCSFCIIPATRGRQRSRSVPEVVAEVRELVRAGYREIVVTGVQISAYRWEEAHLFELVRAILAETEVPRLRLTSIAPWDLDERLLTLWEDRRLCRHLHLSLQSGSTATLRRMRRPYTAESYLRLLETVHAAIPGAAVTTDVIVGFPGETGEEFAESLATVEAAAFARVHVFPFSPRPGTEAAGMPGQVPPEEKKLRMERMLALAARAEEDFRRAHLGQRETVLWERPRDGMGHGLTDNYIRVVSPDSAGLWNRFSEVDLVALAEDGVVGRMGQEK